MSWDFDTFHFFDTINIGRWTIPLTFYRIGGLGLDDSRRSELLRTSRGTSMNQGHSEDLIVRD